MVNDYLFCVIGIFQLQVSVVFLLFVVNDLLFVLVLGMLCLQLVVEVSYVVVWVLLGVDVYSVGVVLGVVLMVWLFGYEVQVQVLQQVFDGFKWQIWIFIYLLVGLGIIFLFGGGVGVMNVMLMSVVECCWEIGVCMVLGVCQWDICNLFLIEVVILIVVGVLLGVVFGVVVVYFYVRFFGWIFFLVYVVLLLGMGSILLVGLFFGFYLVVLVVCL